MPPKQKLNKDAIVATALSLVRQQGADALNARELAKSLGTSTQPIFTHFASMSEVKRAVIAAAWERYLAMRAEDMESGRYPPYKASGMSYIRFAGEEKELFRLLFMRDRSKEELMANEADDMAAFVADMLSFSLDTARRFHLMMWIYVHGIATMIATHYLTFSEDAASALLSEAFLGLKNQYHKED